MLSFACCCTQTCCIAVDEHIACPNTFRWQASLTNFPDLASGVSYGRIYGLLDRWLTVVQTASDTVTGLVKAPKPSVTGLVKGHG